MSPDEKTKIPNCPYREILSLYKEHLPELGQIAYDDLSDDFEHATIHAEIANVQDFLAITPGIGERLESLQLNGAVAFDVDSLLIDGRHEGRLAADGTGAGFLIPGDEPIRKSAGTPATFKLEWHTDLTDPNGNRQRYD